VPVEWVTLPHEPALELIETGVRDRAGAVLIGSAGVGKTWLARTAADRLASQFGRVDWVYGAAPAVPFSAFSDLVEVPGTGKTAAVLRAARESLGDSRLLIVDDAHLLDKLSAALVYQLAVSGAAKLIVTVAPNGPVADEISALWRDDLLARIDVAPPGHDDRRQAALVEEFVSALPGPGHRVLEYLAVENPLSLADVSALAGRAAVGDAEAAGAIVIRCTSTRFVMRWVDPSAGDCARSWWSGWRPRGPSAWWTGYGSRCCPLTVTARGLRRTWPRRPRSRCGWVTSNSATGWVGPRWTARPSWRRD
jgi:hypothetical protein